jgi:hypothetical protein
MSWGVRRQYIEARRTSATKAMSLYQQPDRASYPPYQHQQTPSLYPLRRSSGF